MLAVVVLISTAFSPLTKEVENLTASERAILNLEYFQADRGPCHGNPEVVRTLPPEAGSRPNI